MPTAPAAAAFCAFNAKVQAPRLMTAMEPAAKPAKSEAWQPGVASPETDTGARGPMTSPLGLNHIEIALSLRFTLPVLRTGGLASAL